MTAPKTISIKLVKKSNVSQGLFDILEQFRVSGLQFLEPRAPSKVILNQVITDQNFKNENKQTAGLIPIAAINQMNVLGTDANKRMLWNLQIAPNLQKVVPEKPISAVPAGVLTMSFIPAINPSMNFYNNILNSLGYMSGNQILHPQLPYFEKVSWLYTKTLPTTKKSTSGQVFSSKYPSDDMIIPFSSPQKSTKRYTINFWDSKPLWHQSLTRNESIYSLQFYKSCFADCSDQRVFEKTFEDPYEKAGLSGIRIYEPNRQNYCPSFYIAPISIHEVVPGYSAVEKFNRTEYREFFSYISDLYTMQLREKNISINPFTISAFEGHQAIAKQLIEFRRIVKKRWEISKEIIIDPFKTYGYEGETTIRIKAQLERLVNQFNSGKHLLSQTEQNQFTKDINKLKIEVINFKQRDFLTNPQPGEIYNWVEFAVVFASINKNVEAITAAALALVCKDFVDFDFIPNSWFVRIFLCAVIGFSETSSLKDEFMKKLAATIGMQIERPSIFQQVNYDFSHDLQVNPQMISQLLKENPHLYKLTGGDPQQVKNELQNMTTAQTIAGLSGWNPIKELKKAFKSFDKHLRQELRNLSQNIRDELSNFTNSIRKELHRFDESLRRELRRFDRWFREEAAQYIAVVGAILLFAMFPGAGALLWEYILYAGIVGVTAAAQYSATNEPMKEQAHLSKIADGTENAGINAMESAQESAEEGIKAVIYSETIAIALQTELGEEHPDTIKALELTQQINIETATAKQLADEALVMLEKLEGETNYKTAQNVWHAAEEKMKLAKEASERAKGLVSQITQIAEKNNIELPNLEEENGVENYLNQKQLELEALVNSGQIKRERNWGVYAGAAAVVVGLVLWGAK